MAKKSVRKTAKKAKRVTKAKAKPRAKPSDPLLDDIKRRWPTLTPVQARFVRLWCEGGLLFREEAASAVKITRWTEWHWRKTNEEYAAAIAWAEENRTETLENELIKRALSGPADTHSMTALIFALKAAKPSKYRDGHHAPSHVNITIPTLTLEPGE